VKSPAAVATPSLRTVWARWTPKPTRKTHASRRKERGGVTAVPGGLWPVAVSRWVPAEPQPTGFPGHAVTAAAFLAEERNTK